MVGVECHCHGEVRTAEGERGCASWSFSGHLIYI